MYMCCHGLTGFRAITKPCVRCNPFYLSYSSMAMFLKVWPPSTKSSQRAYWKERFLGSTENFWSRISGGVARKPHFKQAAKVILSMFLHAFDAFWFMLSFLQVYDNDDDGRYKKIPLDFFGAFPFTKLCHNCFTEFPPWLDCCNSIYRLGGR